jgi:hypothetical protein
MSGYAGRVISREDAEAIAEMMVMTGRIVHPSRWVDWMAEDAENAALDSLL